jgi:hypothetical protein
MPPRSLLPTPSALSDDLTRVRDESLPWGAVVRARRTLHSGGMVEAWYLAALFLRMWANGIARDAWKKMNTEGPRTSSRVRAAEPTPPRRRPDLLAQELVQDRALDPYLADHVGRLAKSLINLSVEVRRAGGLVRAAVETHEWCVLLSVLKEAQREEAMRAPLPDFSKSVGVLARSVREFAFSLPEKERAYAAELLTNYRNSTLAFSWMPYCQGDPDSDIDDPLFPNKREKDVIREFAERVAHEFEGIEGVRVAAARSIIERIAEAILQRGYSKFADGIASSGLFSADGLGTQGLPINVIPGGDSGECAPLLVAVAKAGRKSSLTQVIPRVRHHLTKCNGITNGVIIVTDEWRPGILGDTLTDLRLRVAEGKKIIFLLVPQPGTGIVHIPIALT